MMKKYHINPKGVASPCHAETHCPFGGEEEHSEFSSRAEAQQWAEEKNAQAFGGSFATSAHRASPSAPNSSSGSLFSTSDSQDVQAEIAASSAPLGQAIYQDLEAGATDNNATYQDLEPELGNARGGEFVAKLFHHEKRNLDSVNSELISEYGSLEQAKEAQEAITSFQPLSRVINGKNVYAIKTKDEGSGVAMYSVFTDESTLDNYLGSSSSSTPDLAGLSSEGRQLRGNRKLTAEGWVNLSHSS